LEKHLGKSEGRDLVDKEKQILEYIQMNPFITQQELANKMGISRSAVAGYIASLTKRGEIIGRAYILKKPSLITCIGGINLERKAFSKQKIQLQAVNPVDVAESCGGLARNVAENLGRLDCNVALMSCVGNDKEGKWLLQETQKYGVDISQVWTFPNERTSTSTTLFDSDGEMLVSLLDQSIYDRITPEMLREKRAYLTTSQAIFADTDLPKDVLQYIIQCCLEENVPLYIDPVSLVKVQKLPDRLEGINTILPNRLEAEWLAQMPIKSLADCREAAKRILERGVENVVVTLGDQGVLYASKGDMGHLIPLKDIEVVDVSGVGDAFAAGFLYGMIHEGNILRACQLGMASATLTVQTTESVSPLLQPKEIYSLVERI
jgi:pseudouridine kinase